MTHVDRARVLLEGKNPSSFVGDGSKILTLFGRAMDRVAFQVVHNMFVSGHRRGIKKETKGAIRDLATDWEEHRDQAVSDPLSFYPKPDAPKIVERKWVKDLSDGWIEDLQFHSNHAPDRRSAQKLAQQYPENRIAHARHFRHDSAGHPAIVCLHPWGCGNVKIDASIFKAKWLYDLGLDVYLYVHPYHGPRRPSGVLLGAKIHPSTHIARTNEAFLQTVWEVRSLLAYHESLGGRQSGIMGMSLGGYVAALMGTVAPELGFSIPIVPIGDLSALMWSWGEGTADRKKVEEEGITFDEVCEGMALHSPLARPLVIPKDRMLIIAARGDRIVPPLHFISLWEYWDRPSIHWFSGGHLVQFGRNGYLQKTKAFLKQIGTI